MFFENSFFADESRSIHCHVIIPSNDPDSSTVNISLSGVGYGLNVWINQVNSDNCPSISVDVTVTDPRSNSLLNLLTQDNFKLYQNGQLQNITATAIQYPSPVSVVLAIDCERQHYQHSAYYKVGSECFY